MLMRGHLLGRTQQQIVTHGITVTATQYKQGITLPVHAHEAPSMVLVVQGWFEEQGRGRVRRCTSRELYFRPHHQLHSQRFVAATTCLTIEFVLAQHIALFSRLEGTASLDGMPTLVALRLYDELSRSVGDHELIVEEQLAMLAAALHKPPLLSERRRPPWLRTVREMVDTGLHQTIRLEDVARTVGVHRVHLSRTLRQFFGCSLAEYVRRQRVHRACARIRHESTTLSTVAAACGFSDESHMGRAFREVLGCTPRDCRGNSPGTTSRVSG